MEATLPSYIASAKPVPAGARAPWYKNTAPTYAGIFLWFVFWDSMSANGLAGGGVGTALLGVVLGAVICHVLFYIVPGMLGMKTGFPLYIVGTSTFGAQGGLLMPGFLMGLLQFGWLAVSTYFSAKALSGGQDASTVFYVLCVAWAGGAAFMGLKGIQYVARVATYLPLIPLAILLFALVKFGTSSGSYTGPNLAAGAVAPALDSTAALLTMVAAIVGFFATAGAAGVDFGMNNRNAKDVRWGGYVGILLAIVFTAGVSILVVAGAHAQKVLEVSADPQKVNDAYTATNALRASLSSGVYAAIMIGLAVAAFPGACFSSFIAANSFKTVMPRVNSSFSVGIGALVSIVLAMTGVAGKLDKVFMFIGASFGPIVGAMVVDYLLAGRKWAGPRAGWNVAGWGAWLVGFIVGILPNLHGWYPSIPTVPCAPVLAFLVGAVVYFILARLGLESKKIAMPQGK
jgi:cytosine permease